MDSPSEQNLLSQRDLSRRDFLKGAGKIGISLLIPNWLAAACNFTARTPAAPTATVSTEKVGVPNLDLKIDEALFWTTVRSGSRFGLLPDATDKSKLLLAYQNIYIGKTGSLFNIGINKPMADFLISQSKLLNPPLRTNIIFVEDWGEGDTISGEGGFTGITKDNTEQDVVIWLKRTAWQAFKAADKQGLSTQDYYQGFISSFASSWAVHELGHAGAETRALWRRGQQIPQAQLEATHPQVFAFQNQYDRLYDQAGKQGLATNALLVGIEPTVDLNRLRAQINQEAKQRGFE